MSDREPSAAHVPVLAGRVVELLSPALAAEGAVLVDATLGLGGHAAALLAAAPTARLVGLDRDRAALRRAEGLLAPYAARVELVHAVYDELPLVLERLGTTSVQGVLFDLGVSSLQLDQGDRGFSYAADAPLDMRMDQEAGGPTAADVVNGYPADQLARVLREYGEERFAARIASAVVQARAREPFTTTAPLADLVRRSIPAATRRTGGNPAKRTFQALRIEVNDELRVLARALPAAVAALAVKGRLVALAYHSLEDRLITRLVVARTRPTAPPDLPVVPEAVQPRLRALTRGAERAGQEEIEANPRAASARLRAVERVRPAA